MCGRHFAHLGTTLYVLPASTASLHVARLRRFTTMLNPTQISTLAPRLMSALGQKRTYAAQNGMSALPPIATSIAFFGMSALGQKRTLQTLLAGEALSRFVSGAMPFYSLVAAQAKPMASSLWRRSLLIRRLL